MADWYGTSRSSYFLVKDVEAFKEALAPFEVQVMVHPVRPEFVMLVGAQEYGDFPSYGVTEDNEEVELDFQKLFSEHLVEGQVAILMEAGAEKLRYITGYACAYTWDGRFAQVSLSDIYQRVEEDLGVACPQLCGGQLQLPADERSDWAQWGRASGHGIRLSLLLRAESAPHHRRCHFVPGKRLGA